MKIILQIVLLAMLVPTISSGEDKHIHGEAEVAVGVEALSPRLRDLLSREMLAIEEGMMAIIPAYNSGNWQDIEATASKIKNSYILKQSLTESEVEELHSKLPPTFIEKDQRFHYLAGMLEHGAKAKKAELMNFYFSEMNESCLGCHATFATHRFPALSAKEENDKHAH